MKTLVASLGNPMMGDDAVGPRVVELLRQRPLRGDVELRDLQAPGIDLLMYTEGVDSLVLIDACALDLPPGTVVVLDKEQLRALAVEESGSLHQPSLLETLRLARALGREPARVTLVGIAARSFEFGAPLSAEVEGAVGRALDAAVALIESGREDG